MFKICLTSCEIGDWSKWRVRYREEFAFMITAMNQTQLLYLPTICPYNCQLMMKKLFIMENHSSTGRVYNLKFARSCGQLLVICKRTTISTYRKDELILSRNSILFHSKSKIVKVRNSQGLKLKVLLNYIRSSPTLSIWSPSWVCLNT